MAYITWAARLWFNLRGLRVLKLGNRISSSRPMRPGEGHRVQDAGHWAEGLGFRVQDAGHWAEGLGFRV